MLELISLLVGGGFLFLVFTIYCRSKEEEAEDRTAEFNKVIEHDPETVASDDRIRKNKKAFHADNASRNNTRRNNDSGIDSVTGLILYDALTNDSSDHSSSDSYDSGGFDGGGFD